MTLKKSDPVYLLKLGKSEGKKIALRLISLNPDKIAAEERLTVGQVQEIVHIATTNLKNQKVIPETISRERLRAFEDSLVDELIRAGLF